jgi:hypothetical protein
MSISESLLQLQNPQRRQPVPSIDGRICLKMQPQVITDLIDRDSLISANAGHLVAQSISTLFCSRSVAIQCLRRQSRAQPQIVCRTSIPNGLLPFPLAHPLCLSLHLSSVSLSISHLSLSPSLICLSLHLSSVCLSISHLSVSPSLICLSLHLSSVSLLSSPLSGVDGALSPRSQWPQEHRLQHETHQSSTRPALPAHVQAASASAPPEPSSESQSRLLASIARNEEGKEEEHDEAEEDQTQTHGRGEKRR